MHKTTKIWIGIGTFIAAGGSAFAAAAPASTPPASVVERGGHGHSMSQAPASATTAQQPAPAADQGGEGGEQAIDNLPPDLAFAVRVAVIRGHLLVGDELVKQGRWPAALPHFLHPLEEVYGGLREQLNDYHVPPFETALKALADTVKARKGSKDYARARAAVNSALAIADEALRQKQSENWAGFLIEAATETMKLAGGEYGEAIVNGKLAKPVEYQDARGFIWHAASMIESVSDDLEKKDSGALQQVRSGIEALKKAFPTVTPPKLPLRSQADLQAQISAIELAASRLM